MILLFRVKDYGNRLIMELNSYIMLNHSDPDVGFDGSLIAGVHVGFPLFVSIILSTFSIMNLGMLSPKYNFVLFVKLSMASLFKNSGVNCFYSASIILDTL